MNIKAVSLSVFHNEKRRNFVNPTAVGYKLTAYYVN